MKLILRPSLYRILRNQLAKLAEEHGVPVRDDLNYDSELIFGCHNEYCEQSNCPDMFHVSLVGNNILGDLISNDNAFEFLLDNPNLIYTELLSDNQLLRGYFPDLHLNQADWENPYLINVIEDKIARGFEPFWYGLSKNPAAIHILSENLDKIYWSMLCVNTNAGSLLAKYPEKVNWSSACHNTGIIDLLEKNIDKIHWPNLSLNIAAIRILKNHMDKVDIPNLCFNKNAISLLEEIIADPNRAHLISWGGISCNPNAVRIAEKHLDKLRWHYVMNNRGLAHLIDLPEAAQHIASEVLTPMAKSSLRGRIDWKNPDIFTYDYAEIKKMMEPITICISEWFYRPEAVGFWIESHEFETIGSEDYLSFAARKSF